MRPAETTTGQRSPASQKHKALWLLDRLVPGAGVNNIPAALRIAGSPQVAKLRTAVELLVRRHEVLRTVFAADETGLGKEILPPERFEAGLEVVECAPGRTTAELTAFATRPFAFDGTPLLRIGLFTGDGDGDGDGDVIAVVAHHVIFDVTSAALLLADLATLYDAVLAGPRAVARAVTEVPVVPEPEPSERSFTFWREHLRDFDPGELDLWLDTREAAHTTLAGDVLDRWLSDGARQAVRELARELRASEAVVLLAAYYLLLARHGAGPDLVVGSPADIRGREASDAIGYYVNILPMRVGVDGAEGFGALVKRTRDVFLEALSHSDVHVDLLLPEVRRVNSAWRTTLFRHMFNFLPPDLAGGFTFGGLPVSYVPVRTGYSRMDLEFALQVTPDGIRAEALYSVDVHRRDDIELLLDRYDALLSALGGHADRPVGELPLSGERDRAVIEAANATTDPAPLPAVPGAVAAAVRATPAAVAVEDGWSSMTYARLWHAAERTAERLLAAGVGAGDVVGVVARRSPELAAAALGVWLAGAAYLPIDPDHPAQRVAYQLGDSGAAAVLAGAGVGLPDGHGVPELPMVPVDDGESVPEQTFVTQLSTTDKDTCAYLIYTSGSTGRPKGTLVSHGNLANLVEHFRTELGAGPADATLWMTTFAFDISALELFLPLTTGGRLVVAPDEARLNGELLGELLDRHGVGIVQATPTTWRMVLDKGGEKAEDALSGRKVLCGGEPLPSALAGRLLATGCELRNVYGPTETTIWSTSGLLTAGFDGAVHIGTPLRNTRVFIADPDGRELPLGVHGELCIAGAGVALGYHGRPELTAERFGTHPVYGQFYRTGDLARWTGQGTLEVLGRVDRQIKLRGNRIELGEIEEVLLEHPDVTAAAVVASGDLSADAVLVAFVVVRTADPDTLVSRLWEHARGALPSAWLPHDFVPVEVLPVNANQKVDYPALAEVARQRRAAASSDTPEREAHQDELVESLLELWCGLLDRRDLTEESNFFVSGGHSLLAALMAQRVEESTGVSVPLADFFASPTPLALAAHVRALQREGR